MKTLKTIAATMTVIGMNALALAGDARTTAGASSNPFTGGGTATATAAHNAPIGFARTDTRSGPINAARGVAVGVDRDGITLSVSAALAPKLGPAVAANFNMTIDRDGDVSRSTGLAVAKGPGTREVNVGGETHTGRFGAGSSSIANAKAPHGTVRVITRSRSN